MLEFGIGLGWLGWECQNYLWTAGAGTAPVTPQCSCRGGEGNSCSRHSWERPRAAAAHLQAAKTWGKVLQKVLFCPWFGFCALILALEHLGFPCRGSGHCSLISGVLFVQLGVEVGLERGSHKLWNLQNHFQQFKNEGFARSSSTTPQCHRERPGPSHSPSQGFLPLQGLWGECGVSGAALSPV